MRLSTGQAGRTHFCALLSMRNHRLLTLSRSLVVVALFLASAACASFSTARSAVASPGASLTAQAAMTSDVGPEVGWFFGDECSPCDGPMPGTEVGLHYGHAPARPDRKAFTIGLGVNGVFPYVETYMQLRQSSNAPFGMGIRVGGISNWRQGQIYGRVDRRLSAGRTLLWNPAVFYHGGRSPNGQNRGRVWALVNGFGLELAHGPVAFTPSVSVVAAHAQHSTFFQPATPEFRVFGAAGVGLTLRRPAPRSP